ncbi:MAG: hypothetical protein IID32_12280, partial [Planctomycetes bacterium]|nr:hypothetical protein [Planctomycetota bacterium]
MKITTPLTLIATIACSLLYQGNLQPLFAANPPSERTRNGLLALYDFSSPNGQIVKDRSGVGKPVDLRITDTKAVHRTKGSLEIHSKTLIRSDKAASKISDAIRRSGEFTIEAWIRPAKTNQDDPARIVTLSKD